MRPLFYPKPPVKMTRFFLFSILSLSLSCSFTSSEFACKEGDKARGKQCEKGIWITLDSQHDMGMEDTAPACGNNILDEGEECDGVLTRGTCKMLGLGESGSPGCTTMCRYDKSTCIPTKSCGNGKIDPLEECDGTNLNGKMCPKGGSLVCNPNCTLKNNCFECGNGILEGDEQCDGNAFSNENFCNNGNAPSCGSSCRIACCGDGVIEGEEECEGEDLGGAVCNMGGINKAPICRVCQIDMSSCAPTIFSAISVGGAHSCAILIEDESIKCWGKNDKGQSTPPSGAFKEIACGSEHCCAIKTNNETMCWGAMTMAFSEPAKNLVSGGFHTCAVVESNLLCWGQDNEGQSQVADILKSSDNYGCGEYHTCALKEDASIQCWGWDRDGQLDVPEGSYITVDGGLAHTCAIQNDGKIKCWGSALNSRLSPPEDLYEELSVGKEHACAISKSGVTKCWGRSGSGRTNPPSTRFKKISAGGAHACGLTEAGEIQCWGSALDGRIDSP